MVARVGMMFAVYVCVSSVAVAKLAQDCMLKSCMQTAALGVFSYVYIYTLHGD